jgi:hypothetical protein
MRQNSSSPLALVSRALVADRFDLVPGAGDGIADDVFIRIAGTLVRQPRHKHKRLGVTIDKTKSHEAAPK